MNNLGANANISLDPSTPFSPGAYFHGVREAGCNPFVANGGLYQSVGASDLNKWAARHDPDGSLRLKYARMMWAARASDDEIIELGVRR
ncbi:hypothetical protein [Bradyrhizobium liaoningense]|uniref:hypothetical protein n=1 Tax=Bradyrhizobium liaoningense TaxID=43992 RepID=UPI001BA5FAC9|nr:hypothetical protein [Bradyrhizobium liaoningense]MBR0903344.1 hypothetical protein [Bradyrhizobium liaoningense]